MPNYTKMSVNLPDETIATLRTLAERQNTTLTEVIKSAIETQAYLANKASAGAKILVEEPGNKHMTQLVFAGNLRQ